MHWARCDSVPSLASCLLSVATAKSTISGAVSSFAAMGSTRPTFHLVMVLAILSTLVSTLSAFSSSCCCREVSSLTTTRHQTHLSRLSATTFQDLSEPEQRVYSLVESLHKSGHVFRIVVMGNGAILETTSKLGPVMKLNTSPKTGKALLTLASKDQSFEFHLSPSDTAKVVLTERDTGEQVMRVIRFLNSDGAPMCSLILGEDSPEAAKWYSELQNKYGEEMQL